MLKRKLSKLGQTLFMSVVLFTGTLLSGNTTAWASINTAAPEIARTRAWDSVVYTLGGIPESVRKIEYAGNDFYLGENVTDDDFLAVLAAGPKAVALSTARDYSKLYVYNVYILWNADKTVLLVHPLDFDQDEILTATVIPVELPLSLAAEDEKEFISTRSAAGINPEDIRLTPIEGMTAMQTVEYMLSDEYTEAVRDEFYRILNEHRVNNGLRELEVNLDLQEYADVRAVEQRTLFGHTRPDGSAAGSGWYNSDNILTSRYAENCIDTVTLDSDPKITASNILYNWKNSPGHNEHMLYGFDSNIKMAFGLVPEFDNHGVVSSGGIFATGY